MRGIFRHIKDKYVNPKYPFQDRLYFLFGTAGVLSAAAAFFSAIICGLPAIAAITSLVSFFISSIIMFVSLFIKDISIARIICSVFLNFFMFPVLFWVAGGINSGMIFYFILGLCVATLILNGKTRAIILGLTLSIDIACLFLGFINPEWGYALSYTERQMDTISSFLIVSLFIIAVILILSWEYEKEHDIVMNYNADLKHQVITDNLTTLYNQNFLLYTLDEQIKLCNKSNAVMSVVMFDIADFNRVTDCFCKGQWKRPNLRQQRGQLSIIICINIIKSARII